MTEPSSITTLIRYEIAGESKWTEFVDGKDGFFYGIPFNDACRVVKFNPLYKSFTEIGPDFGKGRYKWMCGVRDNNGSIYCALYHSNRILKIHQTMAQWKHSTMWSCQRLVVACGNQGQLPQTITFTICHTQPVGS
jgi:hypothetical protein